MLKRHMTKRRPFSLNYPRHIDIQTSFWMAAHWVWERRGAAKSAGMPFGEESITDSVLLDLKIQNPNELKIFPFNKSQESKTGADWEWCFYDKRKSLFLPILVQAKLLDDKDAAYSHIDRMVGSTGVRQIDRLLETSRMRRIPAIFVFYNHLSDARQLPRVCGSFDCDECWGCSIALASAIDRLLPRKDFEIIREYSMPWVCLTCRGRASSSDLPSRTLDTLRHLYEMSKMKFMEKDVSFENVTPPPSQPFKEAPSYFRKLLDLDKIENVVERAAELQKIALENPQLDGIVLVTDLNE